MNRKDHQKRISRIQILILILSIYVLIQIALGAILTFPPVWQKALDWIDFAICVVFLADWLNGIRKADRKGRFFLTHLPDFLGAIPMVSLLRPLRIVRVIRIGRAFRILQGLRTAGPLFRFLMKNPRRSAFSVYAGLTVLMYSYCSFGLFEFERGVNPGLHSLGDAFWMAFTTLTTVGYGDIYPVTSGGRILAALLVLAGFGLFSLLTAETATVLMKYVKPVHTESVAKNKEEE